MSCEVCEVEYETYPIFLCDDIICFVEYLTFTELYGRWLCKECREWFEKHSNDGMTAPELIEKRKREVKENGRSNSQVRQGNQEKV